MIRYILSMKWCPILIWKILCREGLQGYGSSKIWTRKTFESVAVCIYGARLSVFMRDWEAVQSGYSVYLDAGWDESSQLCNTVWLHKPGTKLFSGSNCSGDQQLAQEHVDLGHVYIDGTKFEREHPRLARRFVDTIERTYSACFWMTDEAFRDAIGDAVDVFLGEAPAADIFWFFAGHPGRCPAVFCGGDLTLTFQPLKSGFL